MDPDLLEALRLLTRGLSINDEAAAELLTLLERADEGHPLSVVSDKRRSEAIMLASGNDAGSLWLLAERIYEFTFLVVIRETPKGNRVILTALPITHPSSTPQ
jgi:hypothetical protein